MTLGELDTAAQHYIRALRKTGTPVSSEIVIAGVHGIVVAQDRTLLKEHGGHIELTQGWALSLMKWMCLVKRRGSTQAKKSVSSAEYQHARTTYLCKISGIIAVHKIPHVLVVNWDQRGLNIVPSSNWTMEQEGALRVEIAGMSDKRQITVTFSARLLETFFLLKFYIRGRLSVVTQASPFLRVMIYITLQIIGLMEIQWYATLRM